MKILIACYSYSNNTFQVAKELQKELNSDFTRIETVKDKWYLFKVWDSLRGNLVPIKPCLKDLRNYDTLIVCCPVWVRRTPAAINEYLSQLKNTKDKKFAVLVTSGGSGSRNVAIHIREYLVKQEMEFMGQMSILNDDIKGNKYQEKMNLFTRKFQNQIEK